MKVLKIDRKKPQLDVIEQAVAVIKQGGVVAYPTDTAYGLAVNALDEKAIGKLFIIKHRVQKPLPVIVDSQKMLDQIAEINDQERALMKKHWPGALTIIFKKKKIIPPFITLGLPTIGVRIPDSLVACKLVSATKKPLTSTSANISGQGNCYTPECVTRMFLDSDSRPELLLDAGELPEVPVSTVVQVIGNKVKVVRPGPVKIS